VTAHHSANSSPCGLQSAGIAATIVAIAVPMYVCACASEQIPSHALEISSESCYAPTRRVELASADWNKQLAVTACMSPDFDIEYIPDTGEMAGGVLLTQGDSVRATVLFAFQLEGTTSTDPATVIKYVKQSEYAAIADPLHGIGGEITELVDSRGHRGSVICWSDSTDQTSARNYDRAFGAFFSDGAVVLLDIEASNSAEFERALALVLSIRASGEG
jgi:hypothetical protein